MSAAGPTGEARRGRRTALRYWLLQVPGTVLLVVVLLLLHRWLGLPWWAVAAITVGWTIKDALLYPFLKHAFDPTAGEQHHSPVGRFAVAREGLGQEGSSRRGYVQLGGELWQAELVADAVPVPAGGRVRVVAQSGLSLQVEPVAGPAPGGGESGNGSTSD